MKLPVLSNKGQSMLELIIALGIGVVIISALAYTTILSLKNSQFAQNQVQATRFAQEAIDKIRIFRERNNPVCFQGGGPYFWATPGTLIWSIDPVGVTFYLTQNPPCYLTDQSPSPGTGELNLENKFSRKIFINNYEDGNKKQFRVEVTWSDSSGDHSSQIETILTNY